MIEQIIPKNNYDIQCYYQVIYNRSDVYLYLHIYILKSFLPYCLVILYTITQFEFLYLFSNNYFGY